MWFEWNGITSGAMGVEVLRLPERQRAGIRGEAVNVPGRSGAIFVPDGSPEAPVLEENVLLCECYLPYEQGGDVAALEEISAWLTGEGVWRQSDAPDGAFRARITDAISFQAWVPGFEDRIFGLTLYAEPWEYIYPEAPDIQMTAAGSVRNPCAAASAPRIEVRGSGDIALTVGTYEMSFGGVSGGFIIDSEAGDIYGLDGTTLQRGLAQTLEEFPLLAPGENAVSWTGTVSRVTITPRWRRL